MMIEQPRRRRRAAVQSPSQGELPIDVPVDAPIPTVEARRQEVPPDPVRPDMRQEPREETSRERADRLSAEILERDEQAGDFIDKFPMPAGGPPDGFTYMWRKKSVYGFEDRSYAIMLGSNGWRPVPVERHPEFMPTAGGFLSIEREGLILMEIPTQVAKHREATNYQRAREQIEIKRKQMNQAPPGTFERDNKGSSLVNIRRGYEPLTIPSDKAPSR